MQKDDDQRVFVNLSLHTDGVVVVARHPTPKDLDCKETSKTSRKQHHHAQTPGGHVPAVQLWLSLPTWLGCPTQALPANTVGLPNSGSPSLHGWVAQHRLSLPIQLGCPTQALPANTVGLPNSGSLCLHGCRRAEWWAQTAHISMRHAR